MKQMASGAQNDVETAIPATQVVYGRGKGTAYLIGVAIRPTLLFMTAFALNVVAAAYATLQVHRARIVDWRLFGSIVFGAIPAAFVGGLIVLAGPIYLCLTGILLIVTAFLMLRRVTERPTGHFSRSAAFLAGGSAGFASGITGVGGGVLPAGRTADQDENPVPISILSGAPVAVKMSDFMKSDSNFTEVTQRCPSEVCHLGHRR